MPSRGDRASARWHQVRAAGALLLSLAALAACGDDSGGEKTAKPRQAAEPGVPRGAVARVGDVLISRESAAHWTQAAQRQKPCKTEERCRDRALEFLIAAQWVLQEAERLGISVTNDDVTKRFSKQKRNGFPSKRKYRAFLRRSGRTEDDLRFQVKVQLLTRGLQERARRKGLTRSAYRKRFRRRYKRQTVCLRAARNSLCGEVIDP
jgi:SurA-like N-terminal domain